MDLYGISSGGRDFMRYKVCLAVVFIPGNFRIKMIEGTGNHIHVPVIVHIRCIYAICPIGGVGYDVLAEIYITVVFIPGNFIIILGCG